MKIAPTMIATTIEQGKRILAAGISMETADMFWNAGGIISELMTYLKTQPFPIFDINRKEVFEQQHLFPVAWSLSALIDLLPESAFWKIARVRGKDVEGIFEDCVTYLKTHKEKSTK